MKVGYYFADLNPHRDRSLGIPNYARDLIDAVQDYSDYGIVALASRSSAVAQGTQTRMLPWRSDHPVGRVAADHLHPLWGKDCAVDLWHYPKGFLPVLPTRLVPVVTTIHDAILGYYHRHHPDTRSKVAWWYWLKALRHAITASDLILTVSESAENQIRCFAEENKLVVPPIVVTFQGSSKERLILDGQDPPFREDHLVAFVSQLPHKGTAELLKLWENWIKGPGKNSKMALKLVGTAPNGCKHRIESIPGIELLPFQSDESLEHLIRTSRGMIVPSLIEGFGLPVLETYYLGAPVMVVEGTACDEILGESALAFRINQQDSFNEVLRHLLELPEAAIASKRLELYQRFSWKNAAKLTLAAYESIAAR